MLRDSQQRWRVEEAAIDAGSLLDGATVGSLRAGPIRELTVLAVRSADGTWVYNPDDALRLEPGMGVIFLGSPDARGAIAEAAASTPK